MDGHSLMIADTLSNLVTGLGTAKDKNMAGRFGSRGKLSAETCRSMYSGNWMAGKIVDAPADDMCREWRTFSGNAGAVASIEEAEAALDLRARVNEALKMAARDGGSAVIMGTGDDPAFPLNHATMGRGALRYLLTVSRFDLSADEIDRDPASPWFGRPALYRMFTANGGTIPIHPSRVAIFTGTPRLDGFALASGEPWGDSIYERLHDAIRDATGALQGLASMMQEAKVDVISIPGLTTGVTNDRFRAAVLSRFALANAAKSINNTLLLDAAETWEQKTLSFAGYPEALDRLLQVVAGAADMPLTRFLSRSPAGLNATGESDLQHWYDHVHAKQRTQLQPTLRQLDTALVRSALGRTPRGLTYAWNPLYTLGADEQAEVARKNSEAVERYARTGMLEPKSLAAAIAERVNTDGLLPGARPAPDPQPPARPGTTPGARPPRPEPEPEPETP